jgi:hypothetical protein
MPIQMSLMCPTRPTRPTRLGAALLALLAPAVAAAQETAPPASEVGTVSALPAGGSARTMARDWMIPPAGDLVLGGSLTFLTADAGPMDRALKFTDAVFVGLHVHYALANRVELSLAQSFLPKQPSYTDELVWQGGALGARVGFGSRYASWLRFAGGPLLDRQGGWGSASLGFQARKSIDPTIVFQGALGGVGTGLRYDDPREHAWLAEIQTTGEIIFRSPRNEVAFWLGTQFHFPVASDSSSLLVPLDPETRVSFHLGLVLAYVETWDLQSEVVFWDRGDVDESGTTLPIFDGGFDQVQLLFAISRRFSKKEAPTDQREIHLAR